MLKAILFYSVWNKCCLAALCAVRNSFGWQRDIWMFNVFRIVCYILFYLIFFFSPIIFSLLFRNHILYVVLSFLEKSKYGYNSSRFIITFSTLKQLTHIIYIGCGCMGGNLYICICCGFSFNCRSIFARIFHIINIWFFVHSDFGATVVTGVI